MFMKRRRFNSLLIATISLCSITVFSADALIKIACVGDSITYGAEIENRAKDSYPAQLQKMLGNGFQVGNFGISARTLLKKGDRPYWNEQVYRDALAFQPDYVIIKLGTNDIKPKNWGYKDDFADDLKALVESFQELDSEPTVFVSYPVPVQETRWEMIEENIVEGVMPLVDQVAKELKLTIVDFHKAVPAKSRFYVDGIHPNAAGAKRMAQEAYSTLKSKGVLKKAKAKHSN